MALPRVTPVAATSAAAPEKAPAAVPEATRPPAPAGAGASALRSYAFANNTKCDVAAPQEPPVDHHSRVMRR